MHYFINKNLSNILIFLLIDFFWIIQAIETETKNTTLNNVTSTVRISTFENTTSSMQVASSPSLSPTSTPYFNNNTTSLNNTMRERRQICKFFFLNSIIMLILLWTNIYILYLIKRLVTQIHATVARAMICNRLI